MIATSVLKETFNLADAGNSTQGNSPGGSWSFQFSGKKGKRLAELPPWTAGEQILASLGSGLTDSLGRQS